MPDAHRSRSSRRRSPSPPAGDDWLHEIKLDGYRTHGPSSTAATVRLITRGGLDWTHRYGDLADAFAALPCREAIIDGEIVVLDDEGHQPLRRCCRTRCRAAPASELVFFAFDLLHLDGWDLTRGAARASARRCSRSCSPASTGALGDPVQRPRRRRRAGVLRPASRSSGSRASSPSAPPRPTSRAARRPGSRPRRCWSATSSSPATPRPRPPAGSARWRSANGSTASCTIAARSAPASTRRRSPTCSRGSSRCEGAAPRSTARRKDIIWVRPVLTAHIHYANLTADGALRHAVFKGLREVELSRATAPAPRERLISEADLATIWVTNPTRRLFGRSGPTKLDVAVYYAAVGDFMLPHLFGRPVVAGALPDRPAAGLLLPAPRLHRHAAGDRDASRPTNSDGEDQDLPHASRTPRAISRSPSSAWSSSTPGAAAARAAREARPHRLRPRSRRGHRLARGGRGGGARPRRARGARARRLRQDHRRQGRARRRADHAEARLEGGARRRPASSPTRIAATAPDTFTTVMGSGEPQAPDLHRLPPQRPQRHRGGALFVAGAQQPAGIGAAQLGRPRDHRRSGGFELFFAPGPGGRVRRSLGRDRRLRAGPAGAEARQEQ